ncbi:MAG: hypothetical protein J6W10_01555 [Kiritimatiellae bacterium]|nr:hypothetical protein [Kiritimatiellia bacterium]
MDLTIDEARKMVANADLWPQVRDYLVRGGEFELFPAGVKSRLKLVDSETLLKINMWVEALKNAPDWKGIVEGDKVRELKSRYPGVYPEVFRYSAYFSKFKTIDPGNEDFMMLLLKLKFPEVYKLCFS